MAFTGTATVVSLGKNLVRITGISLLKNGTSGTIGLSGSAADVTLPSSFPSSGDSGFTMSQLVEVRVNLAPSPGNDASHVHISKTESPFTITIENDNAGVDTGNLEIYVQFHHSITR